MKVAFCCTPSLLDHADQAEEELPPGVTLVQSKRSQRTLQFQQDLLICYSNNTLQVREAASLNQAKVKVMKVRLSLSPPCVQTVPLQASLDLPTISLSTDSIDFGSCYVGKTKTVEVDLHSHGTYTSWTSVIGSSHRTFSAAYDGKNIFCHCI